MWSLTSPPGARPRRTRSLYARCALGFALCAAALSGACDRLSSLGGGGPLVLGLAFPMTDGQGSADVYGVNSLNGAKLAQQEINAAGGINGRKLEFRLKDDQGDKGRAIVVARELASDPAVLAVVGHVYSSTMMKAAPAYSEFGVPAIATTATSTEISSLGPWIFRLASSDSVNAATLARVARQVGARAEVMYSNEDYGQGLARVFEAAYRADGGQVTGSDPYLDAMSDFTPYVRRIGQRGAEVVFIAGSTDVGAAKIIDAARRLGVNARFLGGDGIESLGSRGPAYDGTMIGVLFHPDQSPRAREFAQRYRAVYGKEPDSPAALAYDAVKLLAEGMRAGNTTRASLRRYLDRVGKPGGAPAVPGVAGDIAFDADGDPLNRSLLVGILRNGAIQMLRGAP